MVNSLVRKVPLVSVIITTRNSAATLAVLLKSIKTQTYKNREIIIVDNNSSDKTFEIARRYTSKVFNKGPERSAQRNLGAGKAAGDYLFFLDSDMTLTKNIIKECVDKFNNKNELAGVIVPEISFGLGFWAKVKAFEREIIQGEYYLEAARFFPKKIFSEFEGYDENLTGPEDWDLPRRIAKSHRLGRIKSHILHNEGKTEILNLARKKFYYGLSAHKYLKKHNLSVISPMTLYILRPSFYKNWRKILLHPLLSVGMVVMLVAESIGGGLGYIVGRLKK